MLPIEQLRFFVRLVQIEKVLPPLPTVNDALKSAFFGIEPSQLDAIRGELSSEVRRGAEGLLANTETAAKIDALPFKDGSVVVALGDSLTADAVSWFEVLAEAFRLRHPGKSVQFVNAGVSGEATPQILARTPLLAALQPSHVICLAGGNDARRFGSRDAKTQVSKGETTRNLALLQARIPDAQWLWIAPPALDEARAEKSPFWQSMATFWNAQDVNEISEIVCQHKHAVDLRQVLAADDPELVGDDGLHPTPAGHVSIARAVLSGLASQAA